MSIGRTLKISEAVYPIRRIHLLCAAILDWKSLIQSDRRLFLIRGCVRPEERVVNHTGQLRFRDFHLILLIFER